MSWEQIIRQPATWWTANNPTLLENQLGVESNIISGVETDTGKAKLGNGVDAWASLAYFNPAGGASIGGAVGSGTAGSVLFVGAGGVLAQDNARFAYDDTNNQLQLSAGAVGNTPLKITLFAAQTADALQVFASDGTTKLFAVSSAGIITNAGSATGVQLVAGANDRLFISASIGSNFYAASADHNFLVGAGGDAFKLDATAVAGNTRMFVYDVDNATLERVSVGAADSGGAGFKVLRIPN